MNHMLAKVHSTVNLRMKSPRRTVISSPSFAAVSEAAEVPPTALVSACGGEGHTQGQCSQALGHPGCQLPTGISSVFPLGDGRATVGIWRYVL